MDTTIRIRRGPSSTRPRHAPMWTNRTPPTPRTTTKPPTPMTGEPHCVRMSANFQQPFSRSEWLEPLSKSWSGTPAIRTQLSLSGLDGCPLHAACQLLGVGVEQHAGHHSVVVLDPARLNREEHPEVEGRALPARSNVRLEDLDALFV